MLPLFETQFAIFLAGICLKVLNVLRTCRKEAMPKSLWERHMRRKTVSSILVCLFYLQFKTDCKVQLHFMACFLHSKVFVEFSVDETLENILFWRLEIEAID